MRPDVYMFTDQIVNVVFIGHPWSNEFVLVDTGMPKRAEEIIQAAKDRFGEGARATAIILTHGHFDHVGAVIELVEEWDAPVYAHPEEFPYLTGQTSYIRPDSVAEEHGLVAKMSVFFPTDPINLNDHLHVLPADGSVPYLSDFRWLHVPGHSVGQIALFRPHDGLLLSVDAFVTTRQEDLYQVLTQKVEISGPPHYLTTDWKAAKASVLKLQQLAPEYVIAGHGRPVEGAELKEGLDRLVAKWEELALPDSEKK